MISIDWGNTNIIHVPQSYLTLVSGTLYSLDTNLFRLSLKALEANFDGMSFTKTHNHNTEVAVAGTTYSRFVEILTPYSIEFENGTYSVRLEGSNNNIFDIENGILVQNQVQVIPGNSAGLIGGSAGITPADIDSIVAAVWGTQLSNYQDIGSAGETLEAAGQGGSGGSCSLTVEQETLLNNIETLVTELNGKAGLDVDNPVTITQDFIKFGEVKLCIIKKDNGNVVVKREG